MESDEGGASLHEGERRINVAYVDDDRDFREVVVLALSDSGFHTECFSDGRVLLEHLVKNPGADIILLGGSSIELLSQLRLGGIRLPVVFFTALSDPAYEQMAFDRGAADFIEKKRGIPILASRLHLVAAKIPIQATLPQESVRQGELLLKPNVGRAFWGGVDLQLTITEFKVLDLLASDGGNYVTYRAIYDRMRHVGFVAGDAENGYKTNVRSCIKRMRKKFLAIDPTFDEIENYQTFGYRWGRHRNLENTSSPETNTAVKPTTAIGATHTAAIRVPSTAAFPIAHQGSPPLNSN